MKYEKELVEIINNSPYLMNLLKIIQGLNLEKWSIGAGVIRDIVWSELHEMKPIIPRDIDIVFFDEKASPEKDNKIQSHLEKKYPDIPWEVVNQAFVHLWHEERFGFPIKPISSLEAAISTWPDTATCIGIYLDTKGKIKIIAPYGLDDLFNILLRHNPKKVSREVFLNRIESKNLRQKFPKVKVI